MKYLLIMVIFLASCASEPVETNTTLMQKATELFKEGNYDKAYSYAVKAAENGSAPAAALVATLKGSDEYIGTDIMGQYSNLKLAEKYETNIVLKWAYSNAAKSIRDSVSFDEQQYMDVITKHLLKTVEQNVEAAK